MKKKVIVVNNRKSIDIRALFKMNKNWLTEDFNTIKFFKFCYALLVDDSKFK